LARIRVRLLPFSFVVITVAFRAEAMLCYKLLGDVAPHLAPTTYVTTITSNTPSVKDHVMGQDAKVIAPSPAYIDGALSAALNHPSAAGNPIIILENASLPSAAFVLPGGKVFDLKTHLATEDGKTFKVEVSAAPTGTERSRVYFKADGRFEPHAVLPDVGSFETSRPIKEVDAAEYYKELASRGIKFGPTFLGLSRIQVQGAKANGEITPHKDVEFDGHAIPPPLLDSAIHTAGAILMVNEPGWDLPPKFVALPTSYRRIYYHAGRAGKADKFFCAASVEKVFSGEKGQIQVEFNVVLRNDKGEAIVVLEGGVLTIAKLGGR
jgi:hypothetical protein